MPTANIGFTLPTDHGSGNTWGATTNGNWNLTDAHDHSSGKGVQIPSAGINWNADLSAASNGLTNLGKLNFAKVTALSSGATSLFVNTADNELYWRTNGGVNVKLTSGSSLNAALIGGFTADYGSVGAAASYTSATGVYRFEQELGAGVRQLGKVQCGPVSIFEFKLHGTAGVPTNAVRLNSPAALAGTYDLTFLAALPGSTVGMQVSSTGQMSASNTFASALIAPDFKNNADLTMQIGQEMAAPNANTRGASSGEGQYKIVLSGGTGTNGLAVFPVPFLVGHQITAWTLYCRKLTDNTNTISAQLHSYNASTNAFVDQSAQTNSGNAPGAITLGQTGLSLTLVAGTRYHVSVGMTAGAGTTDEVYFLEVKYQRP